MASLAKQNKPFRYATFKSLNKKQFPLKNLHEPSPTSSSIAVGGKFIAAGFGSKGSVIVLPTKFKGWTRTADPFVISAHGNDIGDLAFSPFSDNILATGGRDGTVKIWSIPPNGLTENLSAAATTFADIDGGANSLKWNPSSDGVLALGCKSRVGILDVTAGVEKFKFMVDAFGKDVVSVGWNYDGSLLSAVGKNGVVALFDPRAAPAEVLVSATKLNNITKPQHALFVGREVKNHLAVVGLDRGQRPCINFFDIKDMSKPIASPSFDMSNGLVLPLYDVDTDLFFITVRGSLTTSIFDCGIVKTGPPAAPVVAPGWVPTHSFGMDTGIKGAALEPKRALNLNKAEVNRYFVLGQDTIQPYSLRVPRKIRGFHADLYPDTYDTKAAQTSVEYFAGGNRDPLLIGAEAMAASSSRELKVAPAAAATGAMAPGESKNVETKAPAPAPLALRASSSSGGAPTPSGAPSPGGRGSVSYVATGKRTTLDTVLARSIYQHTTGNEPGQKEKTYFDLQPSDSLPLCANIAVNDKFFAMPWRTGGGSAVAIFPLAKLGRCSTPPPCIRGHKTQVTTFDLSALDQTLVATGNGEGNAKVWRIPATGLTGDMATGEIADLPCLGKISVVRFHPVVENVLVTTSWGGDGNYMHFWDIRGKTAPIEIKDLHGDQVLDVAFDRSGKLVATTCKDKSTRVIDPRECKLIAQFTPPEAERDTRVLFLDSERVVTVGFGSGGRRSFSLWEIKDTSKPLFTNEMERNNCTAIPSYDEDTQILYIANNGGSFIQLYQIKKTAPYVEVLTPYTSASDVTGHAFFHKTSVDVKKVEVARSLKLSRDRVLPVSWTVLRKRVDYFQDDLFPDTRSAAPLYGSSEWFEAKVDKPVVLVSLCPAGMTPLSTAPALELTDRQRSYNAHLAKKDEVKAKGILGHESTAEVATHFKGIADAGMLNSNRFDAKVDRSKEDVNEDEW